jgi:hypothetical protein
MTHKNFPADTDFIISSINRKSIIPFQSTFIAFWSVNEDFMKQIYHHIDSTQVDKRSQNSCICVSIQTLQQPISYSTHVTGQ